MTRHLRLIAAALLVFGTVAPAATQPAKTDPPVTITGCLVEVELATLGYPAPADGAARDFFVRTPVIQVPVGTTLAVGGSAAAPSSGSSSGAPTSAGAPEKTTLYRVSGIDREQLRPHLGHRIELQGRLVGGGAPRTTAKTTVDASGRATTRVENRLDVAGELHATAIKMVSTSCE